jgi:hypothetical protein
LGIPVVKESIIDTYMTESEMARLIEHRLEKTGKVILRGEYGASASTIHVLDHVDISFLQGLRNRYPTRDRFLVEPFFDTLSSPSSVWFIKRDGSIVHLRTSNQILENGISHLGNEFPVQFDDGFVDRMSFRFAQHLARKGFIGPFGLDYIQTEKGIFATECNPRMTGAIYPWELVYLLEKKGPVRAARSENIKLPHGCRDFKVLKQLWNDVLYDGKSTEGVVIPYNVGPIRTGKVTVLCTGESTESVMGLLSYIKSKLEFAL